MHNFAHTCQNNNPFFSPASQQKTLQIWQLNMAIKIFRNFEISNNSNFEICNTTQVRKTNIVKVDNMAISAALYADDVTLLAP